jgi:hypothetical protein
MGRTMSHLGSIRLLRTESGDVHGFEYRGAVILRRARRQGEVDDATYVIVRGGAESSFRLLQDALRFVDASLADGPRR